MTEIVIGPATQHRPQAGGPCPLHETIDTRKMRPADLRPDIGCLVARIALADRPRLGQEGFEEAIADAGFHQDAGTGEADLAGIVILADSRIDGELEIAIGEDDEG